MTSIAEPSPALQNFLDMLCDAARSPAPHEICVAVKQTLQALAKDPVGCLPPPCFVANPDKYARHLIYQDPDKSFSALAMVWAPGQGTAVHDHAGKWCVECVVQGEIEIVSYDFEGDPHTDDIVQLTQRSTEIGRVGDAGILVPPNEYHAIRNAGVETAVTIHVYEGEMLWCHTFRPREGGGFERTVCELSLT